MSYNLRVGALDSFFGTRSGRALTDQSPLEQFLGVLLHILNQPPVLSARLLWALF
jgi:hypothetical protein